MRVIVQRVKSSQVAVAGIVIGKIQRGLNLLVGIAETDTEAELNWMARKCLELRLFPASEAESSRWERSVLEIEGEILVISQFTLYGDCRKGRRPSFDRSASRTICKIRGKVGSKRFKSRNRRIRGDDASNYRK
jgi:D-aminoacyl-tRNA deacylase